MYVGLIATACGDDVIRIFKESEISDKNQPSYELVASKTQAHSQDVNTVRWSLTLPNVLVSTSDDGDIKLWKLTEL